MLYQRELSKKVGTLAQQFPAVILTGARQVGKTTLLRELFPEHSYLSLDLPSAAEAAETEPSAFLAGLKAPMIIDEVQYAPQLFRALKVLIDQNRHAMGRYILTGSQKFALMKEVSESLAGRAAILTLEPLGLAEVGAQSEWTRILARGLYPELWRQPTLSAADFYSSYVATYLERDVRQLLNVSSLRDFERFIRAAATRSGQLLNRTDLARDVGVSGKTIGEWISVLEASNQISLLEPYFDSVGKRLIKSPKLYFCDTGLLCFLLGLDENSVSRSPLIGSIWETFVYAELRKRAAVETGAGQSFWFYRDAQGRELDFVRIRNGQMDLMECKWAAKPDPRWSAGLNDIAGTLAKSPVHRPGEKMIVCRTPQAFTGENDGVRRLSPNDWLRF